MLKSIAIALIAALCLGSLTSCTLVRSAIGIPVRVLQAAGRTLQ
ncbi:MAG: hypothetical protein Q7Q71_14365 [Verrucomicrobiota bacterium JB023]|nr:hypothetical protein [Verrucomicrobiota bacterium JB023]